MPSPATPLAWITFIAVRRGPMDVGREEYCGPTVVAELASAMQTAYLANDRAATEVLNAGYGTGLVGVQMKQSVGSDVRERETASGFSCSMEFDLSDEMAEKGRSPITSVRVTTLQSAAAFLRRACPTRRTARIGLRHALERFRYKKHSQELCGATYLGDEVDVCGRRASLWWCTV